MTLLSRLRNLFSSANPAPSNPPENQAQDQAPPPIKREIRLPTHAARDARMSIPMGYRQYHEIMQAKKSASGLATPASLAAASSLGPSSSCAAGSSYASASSQAAGPSYAAGSSHATGSAHAPASPYPGAASLGTSAVKRKGKERVDGGVRGYDSGLPTNFLPTPEAASKAGSYDGSVKSSDDLSQIWDLEMKNLQSGESVTGSAKSAVKSRAEEREE